MGLYETKEADYEYRKSMREAYNRGYEKAKAEYDAKLEEVKSRFKDCYYNKGYEAGRAETVEAIPVDWIEAEIKKLRDMDNGFASLSAGQIEAMLKKWREEQNGL